PQRAMMIEAWSACCQRYAPAGVVLAQDTAPFERAVSLCGRRNGVPVAVVQHGMTTEPCGHDLTVAEWHLTWGPQVSTWYRQFGNEGTTFIDTGFPDYDDLVASRERRDDARQRVVEAMQLSPDDPIVVYPTRGKTKTSAFYSSDREEVYFRAILDACL